MFLLYSYILLHTHQKQRKILFYVQLYLYFIELWHFCLFCFSASSAFDCIICIFCVIYVFLVFYIICISHSACLISSASFECVAFLCVLRIFVLCRFMVVWWQGKMSWQRDKDALYFSHNIKWVSFLRKWRQLLLFILQCRQTFFFVSEAVSDRLGVHWSELGSAEKNDKQFQWGSVWEVLWFDTIGGLYYLVWPSARQLPIIQTKHIESVQTWYVVYVLSLGVSEEFRDHGNLCSDE